MPCISLQQRIVYGPVLSRRLGRSFGINLLPTSLKVCSFDCCYCQYGKTNLLTRQPSTKMLPEKDWILEEVENALKKPRTIDTLTFSGNGEPTLHPDIFEIVQGVEKLRNKYRREVKIAMLSNSTCLARPEVMDALQLVDLPMMKLDAGDKNTFIEINQPAEGITFDKTLQNLARMPKLMIQTIVIGGEMSNNHGQPFHSLVEALVNLRPELIHIYTLERPAAYGGLAPVSHQRLQQIKAQLRDQFALNVEAY